MIIEQLAQGKNVSYRPRGNSMTPIIYSGDLVTLTPCTLGDVEIGDVVLCKVKGTILLHLCTAKKDGRVLISNNHGHDNGWTSTIFGKMMIKSKPKKEKANPVEAEADSLNCIWRDTAGQNDFLAVVTRVDQYLGLFTATHIPSGKVIDTQEVPLSYGAFFGPDLSDVDWWETLLEAAMNKYSTLELEKKVKIQILNSGVYYE